MVDVVSMGSEARSCMASVRRYVAVDDRSDWTDEFSAAARYPGSSAQAH